MTTQITLSKRLIAAVVIFTFTVTGLIQDMAGLHVYEAFALPPGASSYGAVNIGAVQSPVQSFQTDLFTGRAQFSVPIFAPSGRRGINPQVSLNYSSSAKNSWVGHGWSLELGFIQRSTKNGVPAYNNDLDTFTFMVGGINSDLVKISDTEYRAKDEAGQFLKFVFQNNYWVVIDKSGTAYTFGETPQARSENPHGIFCWCLEKVKDLFGNTIEYAYTMDQGEMYVQRIDYNSNEDQNFLSTHSVEFILEDRSDAFFSYITGAKVTTAKRLKEIQVKVQGSLSRKYNLAYEQSPGVGRSRLISVQECGTDGIACLPAIAFQYQETNIAFQSSYINWGPIQNPSTGESGMRNITGHNPDGAIFTLMDMNGDGLLDRVIDDKTYAQEANPWNVYLNTGSGFSSTPVIIPSVPKYYSGSGYSYIQEHYSTWRTQGDTVDFNGDGLPDRIIAGPDVNDWKVYWNNGTGFETSYTNWGPIQNPSTGESGSRNVFGYNPDGTIFSLMDMNGDGLLDRVFDDKTYAQEANPWNVYLNTGSGFSSTPVIIPSVPKYYSGSGYSYIQEHYDTWRNQSDTIDLNGDGLPDRIIAGPDVDYWKVYWNEGEIPDLLKTMDNGRGGITTIEYTPSTQFDNTDLSGLSRLPFPVQVVTKVTQSDGLGNQYVTEYSYKGGMLDAPSKEFRGFRETTVTDAEGTKTLHTFHQDEHKKGRTISVEVKDVLGNVISREENTWNSSEPMPGSHFVYLEETNKYQYDGNSSYKQTRQRFEYDTVGNLKKVLDDGDVDVTMDDRRTENTFVSNPDLHLQNTLAITRVFDYQGQEINEKYFYYDGHADVMAEPVKGALTKSEDFLEGQIPGQGLETVMTYDDFGNVLTVTDAMERVTINEYDLGLKLYLVKVTNHLGHIREFTYDPLIVQITEDKDQNGQITKTFYDPFGRAIKIVSSLDTALAPTQGIVYDDVNNRVITHIKASTNAPDLTLDDQPHMGYLTTYTFTNGLGQEIQKRAPAENSNQQIVRESVTFDARGQVRDQYVPYFASFSTSYVATPTETPKATFTYDAIGRRTEILYQDGTISKVFYDDFVKITRDQNNHEKRFTQDAYGNLVKTEECANGSTESFCSGGTIYTTTYEYDALNRLVQTTNHLGHQTIIGYDLLGRKTSMQDPNMGNWIYTYDENNNLKTQKDAKNQTITFHYDELNRLTRKVYPDQSEVNYVYDDCPPATCGGLTGENYPIGRLLKIDDASGTHRFRYDKLGRVIQDSKTVGDGRQYTFLRIYDPLGRVTSLQYPDSEILTPTFNGMGEAETLKLTHSGGSQSWIFTNVDYNPSGLITKLVDGNGVTMDYTYNPQTFRLEHLLTHNGAQVTLQDLTYQFDNVGNVMSITDTINTNTQTFNYDHLDRLALAINSAVGGYGTHAFSYNAIGNMLTKGPATLEYLDPNHPQAVTKYTNGEEVIDYVYDANGNMTTRGLEALTYDYDNRLTLIQTGNQLSAQYVYDATGQRVKKVANNKTTYYLGKDYEVEHRSNGSLTRKAFFLGETRIAEEEVFTRTAITKGGPIETLEPEAGYEDATINQYMASPTPDAQAPSPIHYLRWFHGDHLGSTNVVTNSQGNQVLLMEYLPYGEVKVRTGSDAVTHTFTGHEEDLESNLIYANARYYDPKIGRFITPDTFVQAPDDPQSHNRYAYARNNPVKFIDPTGNGFWIFLFWLVVIAATVNVTIQAAMGNVRSVGDLAKAALVGAVAGALAAAGGAALGAIGVKAGLMLTLGEIAVGSGSSYVANGVDNSLNGRSFNQGGGWAALGGGAGVVGGKIAAPIIQRGVQAATKVLKPVASMLKTTLQNLPFADDVASFGTQLRSSYDDIFGNELGHARIEFADDVSNTFGGKVRSITLQNDVEVGRFWDDVNAFEKGRFFATNHTMGLIEAGGNPQGVLNLQNNAATKSGRFIISKGTTVDVGRINGGHPKATQVVLRRTELDNVRKK